MLVVSKLKISIKAEWTSQEKTITKLIPVQLNPVKDHKHSFNDSPQKYPFGLMRLFSIENAHVCIGQSGMNFSIFTLIHFFSLKNIYFANSAFSFQTKPR